MAFRTLPAVLPLLAGVVAAVAATSAPAQDYPSRPIRLIVQTQPGGLIDQLARTFGQKLTENTGAVVVVENRTGGGGLIAAEHVLNSPADGYTVYVASHGSQAIHPHLTKLSFDPVKAFAPVIYLATTPTLLVVHPSVPAKSLQDLIALAKANPGKFTYASQGNGSSGHVDRRAVQAACRRRPRARAVQRRGAGGARPGRRPRRGDVRHRRVFAGAGDGRQAARARGRRGCAGEVAAGGADHGGSGPAGDAGQSLVRPGGRGRHAAAGRSIGSIARRSRRSPPRTCRRATTRKASRCRSARRKRSPRTSPRSSKRWGEVIRRGNISLK